MTEKRHSRTGLLMTEIILVILFFAIAAACCLRVFAGAARLSARSEQLKLVLNSTENFLQQLESVECDKERLLQFYPEESFLPDDRICFDKEGYPCAQEAMNYQMIFTLREKVTGVEVELLYLDEKGEELYHLITRVLEGNCYETEKQIDD